MISIIILNYNDWELTEKYARKMEKMSMIDKIVIVDNCSPDGSYNKLRRLQNNRVDVIQTEANDGYAKGNNFGINYVNNKYGKEGVVIISNPDIVVEELAVSKITNALKSDQELFAVSGLVHGVDDNISPIFTWKLPTMPKLFINSSVLMRNLFNRVFNYGTKYGTKELDLSKEIVYCDALPGCFFAADLKKWNELGGFCEKTFLFFEEDILFSKAKGCNYKVALIPSAKIIHLEGATVKKNLNSWKRRELILEDSCKVYISECLHHGKTIQGLYSVWNRIWLLERYLFYKIKAH